MSKEKSEKTRENEEKSVGLSNSRQNPPKLGTHVLISVDRITIIGVPKLNGDADTSTFMRVIYRKWKKESFFKLTTSGNIINPDTDENIAYFEVPQHQQGKIRVDYNPKRLREEPEAEWAKALRWLLDQLQDKRFSRLDIAFDMIDLDVKGYQPYIFGASRTIYMTRAWEVGSIYAGARGSRLQIRFYDKKLERKANHEELDCDSYWRLEMQLRGSKTKTWYDDCKKKLDKFYRIDPHGVTSLRDKITLLAIKQDEKILAELSKNSRVKFRKLMQQPDNQDRTVTLKLLNCLEESKQKIVDELESYLGEFRIKK
ncbi:replication initiation factor domain-containing protein [Lactobacillus johnsonii]|uniref:Replication initiation factor n=1 Tax=Lactobacillus johnsonii ATCC 33200 TaxID=525330 RepID=C2E7V5_LACJH|nr:replication initiation factor domain-containing protein [Lactobacillus johnsonii]EEJ59036.1 replication initiation factor [Lactobacillus johnsonii ATCC 33200]MCF0084963.1 replication initiation factor domain-containing protein [Lactobacillus johnsonii]MCT3324199.1 RepC [Lactobacillus johnsonii]MCT3381730.1 RepC [Lactobacillus johnsonii]MCT3385029.1 RepC [Lactobacillus johnsonii]